MALLAIFMILVASMLFVNTQKKIKKEKIREISTLLFKVLFNCLRASGLKATNAEAQGRATRTATTQNKHCEKAILLQHPSPQPPDHRSTALPLELERMYPRKLNFSSPNPANCLFYNNLIKVFFSNF